MAKCAGCGDSVKRNGSMAEEIGGKILLFCCRGCRRLYDLKNVNSGMGMAASHC